MTERRLYFHSPDQLSPALEDFVGVVRDKYHFGGSGLLVDSINAYREVWDDQRAAYVKAFFAGKFYQGLSSDSKDQVRRALAITGDNHWAYGTALAEDNSTDVSLFDHDVPLPRHRMPATNEDSLIFSGVVGWELLAESKQLQKLAAGMEEDPLRRVILAGGAALIAARRHGDLEGSSVSYRAQLPEDKIAKMLIGADIHGDFRMIRQELPSGIVLDPLGRETPFARPISRSSAASYHSTELGILSALLVHAVGGKEMAEQRRLHENIMKQLEAVAAEGHGNEFFADYGDSSAGGWVHGQTKRALATRPAVGEVLRSLLVSPDDHELFTELVSQEDGVLFRRAQRTEDGSKVVSTDVQYQLTIPNQEIETFIVHLLSSQFGRTSRGNLTSILDILIGKEPEDR